MRVGLYGGCFNPVHNGHLAAARGAAALLVLDLVVFIPSRSPPLKGDHGLVSGEHRLAMLEAAISGEPKFVTSCIELTRAGPSYTLDTVKELRARLPQTADLFFLLGSDCLPRLPRWRGIAELHELVRFVILPRPGHPIEATDPRLICLDLDLPEISSTQIRSGEAGRVDLVPQAVAAYMVEERLYSCLQDAQ